MMILNSTDLKDENNELYKSWSRRRRGRGTWSSDLGAVVRRNGQGGIRAANSWTASNGAGSSSVRRVASYALHYRAAARSCSRHIARDDMQLGAERGAPNDRRTVARCVSRRRYDEIATARYLRVIKQQGCRGAALAEARQACRRCALMSVARRAAGRCPADRQRFRKRGRRAARPPSRLAAGAAAYALLLPLAAGLACARFPAATARHAAALGTGHSDADHSRRRRRGRHADRRREPGARVRHRRRGRPRCATGRKLTIRRTPA